MSEPSEVSNLLTQIAAEPAQATNAVNRLMPLVYDELRELAAQRLRDERNNHTLQPTALVHEAYLRLVDQRQVDWAGQTHFRAIASEMMFRVLCDHARNRNRLKRGGDWQRVTLAAAEAQTDLGPRQRASIPLSAPAQRTSRRLMLRSW
jgi:RNA polymerase sigma factor (TIGR02999 family)